MSDFGKAVREQFDSLSDASLVYLDSAATTLKPRFVIDAVAKYYAFENGSPNRGAHRLSVKSTQLYKQSKSAVKDFLSAGPDYEVVYTRNATECLNLIAESLPVGTLKEGDEVLISITSHHSNILPWQRLCRRYGAKLVYLYTDENGQIPAEELKKISERTKVVSVPFVSNGNGAIHPVKKIVELAKAFDAITVVDAAQAVGHMPVDLKTLDCDLLVFSGHKLYASQGIGVLVGKRERLEVFEPYTLGGDMIEYVTEQEATFAPVPEKFESGTQNVAGAVGLMSAIEWLTSAGYGELLHKERKLTDYLYESLKARPDIEVYGPIDSRERGALVSFNIKGVHPHDVATILDDQGVAIRAGHHCCQPLMSHTGTHATCRASLGVYNSMEDIDRLIKAIDKVQEVFRTYA
ncbi:MULTISPECIES: aminotransferase class V-fold PLP-dependent enzyme [unclassified Fusibacter]|uniref:aminotransferase class V-fold PLP-dependent enzyme n=1 Tax=unclassified Fusibacter TaxID=2624464 RepID=UPI001012374F|nr:MULTISPECIES: SufS family cysteine desulfurase [unclassified Fusibacter]MCK8060957.1 SufS family cysteine desulfurase [Fusibacter sp. A2]NPE23253.1 SufS family cysteine desulfurase [Fusibacter sp. A1]RXV59606.1 SufS family cysteine desulfurase [Fusibacter sp. A1]